jgi:CPA1 family monovalent cation:H+ antiporter
MPISEVLLITFTLLLAAMIAANLCRHIAIPYTVVLVILGIGINLAEQFLLFANHLQQFHLTPDVVLFIFLPALIFESTLSLDARALLKNLIAIVILAIPGMLISALLVGLGLGWSMNINLIVALIFGALISATDPVAVVTIFKELGVSKRLMILVEGESLFNDATAIVLFNIMLSFMVAGEMLPSDILPAISQFLVVFFGGIFIGTIIGLVMSELMVRLYQGNHGIPVILSMAMAYFSFILAEHYFHVSGVMAVLTAAICLNATSLIRLSHNTIRMVRDSWEIIVLTCNSLLFILIGLSVDIFTLLSHWNLILWAVIAVAMARAFSVYLLTPLTTYVFNLPKISLGERHIMWWGGLKGGLAIAVVLSIPDSLPEKQLLIELTLGVVLVSLLLNASTIKILIHWLKLDHLSSEEEAELEQNTQQIKISVNKVLNNFSKKHLLGDQLHASVEIAIASNLKEKPIKLSLSQRLEQLHLQALQAEKEELEFLHEVGLINYYTFISFMEVLKSDKERDARTVFSIKFIAPKRNFLTRIEMTIIQLLGHHEWSLAWLMKYQNLRFSNRIQHDIAGILMAHNALKAIKDCDLKLSEEKLSTVKKLYKSRLSRRQKRLKDFSELYPEFYQSYEYLLFQQVALTYALKQLEANFEAAKISSKVYNQLRKKLHYALKQLPKIKTVISSKRKHQWMSEAPLFAGLPQKMLETLAQKTEYVNFLPDDIVFNEHDKGHSLYILVNGRVDVYKENEQGDAIHLIELHEGSFIGEHALLMNSRRSATIKAKTYVTLLRLTAAEVLKMSKIAPELEIRLREADLQRQVVNLKR